jgi:hypothetical protein
LQRKSFSLKAPEFDAKKPFKSPLVEQPKAERRARKIKSENNDETQKSPKISICDYEATILNLLSKPFKCPLPGWIPEYTTKTLGLRKILVRR